MKGSKKFLCMAALLLLSTSLTYAARDKSGYDIETVKVYVDEVMSVSKELNDKQCTALIPTHELKQKRMTEEVVGDVIISDNYRVANVRNVKIAKLNKVDWLGARIGDSKISIGGKTFDTPTFLVAYGSAKGEKAFLMNRFCTAIVHVSRQSTK